MSTIIESTSPALRDLGYTARHLRDLARAFRMTGNDTVAMVLEEDSHLIDEQVEVIRKAIHDDIHRGYVQAQENAAPLVKGVLAGVQIGKGVTEEGKS